MQASDETKLSSTKYFPTPKTILPSDVKLTKEESDELYELEQVYDESNSSHSYLKKFSLDSANNVGLHYFCLENDFLLDVLASNENISSDVAVSIFLSVSENKNGRTDDDDFLLFKMYALLMNPVVFYDFQLFEAIINENIDEPNRDLLFFPPHFLASMPVSILLFLLPKVNLFQQEAVRKAYFKASNLRKVEILEWVKENKPDLANLPLSWVLRAYGFQDIS